MLRDLASFLFFLSLLPFLFHGVQETSPDLRIWLLANLEEFFKFIISHCHSFPSSTFFVSFRFILLIFMSSCLAKLVFCGLYHFEEYSFARSGSNCGDSHRELSKLQPYFIAVGREGGKGGGVWRFCSVTAKFTWSPRRLFNILRISSLISSQFY